MTDRPIIFSGPMVRALLAGTKTQTRRLIRNVRNDNNMVLRASTKTRVGITTHVMDAGKHGLLSYAVGDYLWVREAHAFLPRTAYRNSIGKGTIDQRQHPTDGYSAAVFREGFDRSGPPLWRPSIHMPRWASRITLKVTDVRVQLLQDISESDAQAEGVGRLTTSHPKLGPSITAIEGYSNLWTALHGPAAWACNPWVVAVTFEVDRRNIDEAAP